MVQHLMAGVAVGLAAAVAAGLFGFGVLAIVLVYSLAGTAGLFTSAALDLLAGEARACRAEIAAG